MGFAVGAVAASRKSYTVMRYGPALLGSSGPSLHLGTGPITASDHVRLLGVTVSSDLTLEKHVSGVCSTCFYWLRQIRRI